ncbi:hypothetical protein DL96DRAFT_119239 [Flagelloscypha sp. PMI_526]|nr:hypothetical protein DL96DRAFT_119239 [Flagelloscypha sp. PMI_526]
MNNSLPIVFQVLFASDFIIAIDEVSQAMVVYPLPEMPPKRSYDPQVSAQLYNPALLCTPEETKELNRSETFTMYWKTLPNRGHLASSHDGWASLHDTGEKDWLLERFEIFHADPSSSTFTPLPLKCERSYSRHPHSLLIGEGWSATLDVSSDQTILLHTTSKEQMQVIFHLSSSDEDNGGIELGRGILYDSNSGFQGDTKHYSLCPFAGRMCVSAPGGIKVVDFVEMPYMKE